MHRALFAASLALLIAPAPAFAAGLAIAMDEVRTVTFDKPVATVYVGNPAIADINMIDARHAFVIGKGFGNTNIMALDADGKQVANTAIAVLAGANNSESTLLLNRGTQRVTYSCTSNRCETTPEPGDGKDAFETINSQLATHSDTAHKAAVSP
ncbi:MAG TPA: pilus assembly protein N-terminal domain-containing protein [Rhizomicrobium sp.]|jgi:Flp pilus assembly secretin CpaC|nr:pilus assembly protein N-terminal domain-containing protein [Rhizomicrobium sp.]